MSLGDILSGAFKTIRFNPGLMLGAPAIFGGISMVLMWFSGVFGIFGILISYVRTNIELGPDPEVLMEYLSAYLSPGRMIQMSVLLLLATLVLLPLSVTLPYGAAQAAYGNKVTLSEAFKAKIGRLLPLIGAEILLVLIVYATLAIPTILFMVGGIQRNAPMMGIGALLHFIAAIILFFVLFRLFFVPTVVILEDCSPIAAFKRSRALVKGSFWRIVGISLLGSLIVGIPAEVIGGIGFGVAFAIGSLIVFAILLYAVSVFITPFSESLTVLLYLDSRFRKGELH
jgi:hypothetical protein